VDSLIPTLIGVLILTTSLSGCVDGNGDGGEEASESDFSGADLSSSDMSGSKLSGFDFTGANLRFTNLTGADLSNSILVGADLSGANLSGANLSGAILFHADLSYADLRYANLSYSDMERANLGDANLWGANLDYIHAINLEPGAERWIWNCPRFLPMEWKCLQYGNYAHVLLGPKARLPHLYLTNLKEADGTSFQHGQQNRLNLTGADLSFSTLSLPFADLREANLSRSELGGIGGANLSGADLSYARFERANLTDVDLTGANMFGIRGNDVHGCPAFLPAEFTCIVDLDSSLYSNDIVGPYVNLYGAQLRSANLSNTNLSHVTLSGANLDGANFSGAIMFGLSAKNLQACPFSLPVYWHCVNGNLVGPHSDLSGADLTDTDLSEFNLTGANLRNSDLTGANLTNTNLTDVIWDWTTCPDGTNTENIGPTCENNL